MGRRLRTIETRRPHGDRKDSETRFPAEPLKSGMTARDDFWMGPIPPPEHRPGTDGGTDRRRSNEHRGSKRLGGSLQRLEELVRDLRRKVHGKVPDHLVFAAKSDLP
jgi:hypothetical protein